MAAHLLEKRTVLFIVEDLHWSDASSQEFLGQFIAEGPLERILTLLTFRPEFKMPRAPVAHQTILALNRLTRRQVAEWMRRDSNGALPESLVAQIYQRTGGVPLLVKEFSRMVRESFMFKSVGSETAPNTPGRAGEIPATLQDLVIARLDRMASNREVAQLAATLGRRFDYDLLAAVVPVDEQTLRAWHNSGANKDAGKRRSPLSAPCTAHLPRGSLCPTSWMLRL
jgi:predicted ATPase